MHLYPAFSLQSPLLGSESLAPALLFQSGLHQRDVAGGSESLNVFGFHINDADIVTTISIGAAMIALHSVLHLIIDVDYLVRGKLPPERARSGH